MTWLLPLLFTIGLTLLFRHQIRSSNYGRQADEAFLAQVGDPDLRKKEIARLSQVRKYLSFSCMLVFFPTLLMTFFSGRNEDNAVGWMTGLLLLLGLLDVQNKLRLLLLAQKQSGDKQ